MTMYEKRIKVFIAISLALLLVCVLRLVQMQLLADSSLQDAIARLKGAESLSKSIKTLRGKILDRHGEVLAADVPQFHICIGYPLSCFLDERVIQAKLAKAKREDSNPSLYEVHRELDDKRQDLERIIEKCARFGVPRAQIEARIKTRNDELWDLRNFLCWYRGSPDPNVIAKYGGANSVPTAVAVAELERQIPDQAERYKRVAEVDDVPDMRRPLPLVELTSEDHVFAAQLEFMEDAAVRIQPTGQRSYPYGSVAAQTIGWVGGATQPRDTKLFEDDPLSSYLSGEVCGRLDGVEYVCESILRGRRGELVQDIDQQLVREADPEFGRDVQLTLDIRLQKRIEERLTDPQVNPDYCRAPTAAAIVEVSSGDILALVSLPAFDLNRARYDYSKLVKDPNRPLTNRTINHSLYPPGSVAKPLLLIAGLESGAIRADETISCPDAPAPAGWPNCLIYKKYKTGHDTSWINNARNAMKGSCNIYFSRLADRMEPRVLQEWLFKFGYGHEIPLSCPVPPAPGSIPRRLNQTPGQIGSALTPAHKDIESVDDVPPLLARDKPMFGIGQGNFRVTPLQVANAFAALARGGRFQPPRLFLSPESPQPAEPVDLQISPSTLQVVYEGMSAVANERGGTAYDAFAKSGLTQQGVKVYGKTGSTERPYDAWFGGFAADDKGAKIAVAIVIEGGQHGSSDAAPLGREIIQLCVEAGYLGHATPSAATRPPGVP
ncbi:MAG: hypothetical protein A2Y77_10175 [Planctomycetes bacterium RBG_13_62_9]|nr:MAG: hypothetical protein A2Y77_10175 [Planctomycetes bacterium RBG_13_62_9]